MFLKRGRGVAAKGHQPCSVDEVHGSIQPRQKPIDEMVVVSKNTEIYNVYNTTVEYGISLIDGITVSWCRTSEMRGLAVNISENAQRQDGVPSGVNGVTALGLAVLGIFKARVRGGLL
jgi:hypothetical protein